MVYNRDGTQNPKKPRMAFAGKLVSIATDNAGVIQEIRDEDGKTVRVENAFTYLDLAIVDESQTDPATGKNVWHDIRLSGSKDKPILMEEWPVLKQCDELIRSGAKPQVRGQFYLATKVPTDANGDPLMKDGKPVVYKNKRMSVADLQLFEIVSEVAA